MKKKAIEKVPFLTLPKVKRGKRVEYVALTDIREIGGEEHLFVEVYQNRKEQKEVPVVRVVLTEKDFGTYFPESGMWSRGKISRNTWSNYGLIWREGNERIRKTVHIMAEENVLYYPEDLKRIQDFTRVKVWNPGEWWEYIDQKQTDITAKEWSERSSRKWKRRQQALKERGEQTPELPEERILEYADACIFLNEHYLYYKKHGAKARVACSSCGGVADARWKPGQSYESQFERMIEEPIMGIHGTCPLCGTRGKYMPQGKVKSSNRKREHLFLGQKYKENGLVLRYVEVEKEWQLEFICGEKGVEMYSSREKLSGIEVARIYFEPGKKIQKDYQKHNYYDGENFWDDCNLSGLNNISIREGRIMPETYENMKGTFLQYSALKEYEKAAVEVNPADYLERYLETPQIEMLVKLNLIGVVKNLVRCRYGIVQNADARRPDEFLGIRKEQVRLLMKNRGDLDLLKVMQMEKRMGASWSEEQVEQLAELDLDYQISTALEHMGVQQFLNRVAKYAGCGYGNMCSAASAELKQTAQTYIDYLTMRKDLGYDLQNTVYLFPRDLRTAHNKMVMEQNKEEADKRIREVCAKYPLIKKHYRRLRKRFYFEDEEFLIRPARDAGEIVMEGRILHHCVGRDDYLKKHNEDRTTILFLRSRQDPETPYITVEIETQTLKIRQWYGAHDEKPDQKRMQKWLDQYVTRLKCAGEAAGQIEAEDAEQRILVYA